MLTPNLHFAGECEAAMALYARAFGAQRTMLFRYGEHADAYDPPLQAHEKAYVYHAEMVLCGHRVMMSDERAPRRAGGIPVSIVATMDTAQQVRDAYDILREGATVVHAMTETSYSSCFVSLVDRYGVRWELMTETT